MNFKLPRKIPLLLATATLPCLLAPTPAHALGLSLGLELDAGEAGATLPSDASSPQLAFIGAGAVFELHLTSHLFLGADADYSYVSQYSAVDPSLGNRRGTYLNPVAPLIGAQFGPLSVRVDYRFMGHYALSNVNVALQSIQYDSPSGGRLSVGWQVDPEMRIGAFYERVDFGEENVAGAVTTLGGKFTLWQAGASIGFFL